MGVSINTNKSLGVQAGSRIVPPPASGFEDTTSWALDGSDEFLDNSNSFNTLPADDSSSSASGAKWTINMWVKFDSISGNQYIYYISEAGGTLVTYLFVNGNGRLQAFVTGSSSNWTRSGNSVISAGTWYMISVKYDSTISNRYQRLRIRVNGATPTGHVSNFLAANHAISENIHLGTNFAENSPMEGNINEPAIFNGYYASDAELLDLYNSGAATDLNTHSTVPTNWFRSENATWDGSKYTMTDEMGTGKTIISNNMEEADRDSDVPT